MSIDLFVVVPAIGALYCLYRGISAAAWPTSSERRVNDLNKLITLVKSGKANSVEVQELECRQRMGEITSVVTDMRRGKDGSRILVLQHRPTFR